MAVATDLLPRNALLQRYNVDGHYADCFVVVVPRTIDLVAFIQAFYTTRLFRLERLVLSVALRRRITDTDVDCLARAETDAFAAWTVEARRDKEILLCDIAGRTRSWLACETDTAGTTTLRFGSAVLARDGALSPLIRATIPLHRCYARALLRAAHRRLLDKRVLPTSS
ncbi:MAG: hypothetical protein AAF004_04590 [Pseudomonadota bacterium]